MERLKAWKESNGRKPLFMLGARQVGKTWALKKFGEECFRHCAYFSLDEDNNIRDIFIRSKNPKQIIEQLRFLTDVPIEADETLIILDEIQSCPEAISSMKYFCEHTPEYAVACAGSLLGLAFGHEGFSFPVGKVDHMEMHPVTFIEFLGVKEPTLQRYVKTIDKAEPLPDIFFEKLTQAFNAYRASGGMPEAALCMANGDIAGADKALKNILRDYSFDFVKHTTPSLSNRVQHVWASLPSQLAKENRKFVYQVIRPGARAREYEVALLWLSNAGLINRVSLCETPRLPLSAYEELSIFKVYCLDIGLLRAMARLDANIYMTESEPLKEFKGALAENYVLQSLLASGTECRHYWSSGNQAEVEFIAQRGMDIVPIEVKPGTSVMGRSLTEYYKRYSPKVRVRYSMLNLRYDNGLLNIPLFLADRTEDILRSLQLT